ncbi:MAG TPA: hypothetical protein VMD59_03935 [Acidimicrobiales bacterium]|nr:hypothetical protein [Acidimicrobiales bacterium]
MVAEQVGCVHDMKVRVESLGELDRHTERPLTFRAAVVTYDERYPRLTGGSFPVDAERPQLGAATLSSS